ncbi:MAG: methylated-DNA--[protein]-cysteine S-methyltransferase [Rhodoferax sp.]|nr:methylated-DNA--[protein]-cysteine S-methyltransferase [Rhodoferax sp.]
MNLPSTTTQADFASPMERMILAAAGQHLVGVWFADQAHLPDLSGCPVVSNNPLLKRTADQLTACFAGQRRGFDLPLAQNTGTSFQNQVWQALTTLPCGSTCSYGALAARVGRSHAVRAVAAAVARNPISIIVPCHRVMGVHGNLTGYAGGLARRAKLPQLEGAL